MDNKAISNEIYEQITLPARQFKEILASRIVDPSSIKLPFQDPIYTQALQRLTSILTSYPVQYAFEQNNIYYDAKANPCEHMMAFHQLARLFETLKLPIFNCFPLRRIQIPNYTTIDTLKPQELGVLRFRRTIQTEGVGVTVLKKRQDRKHTKSCQGKMEKTKKYCRICEAVKPQKVQNTEDTLVNFRSLDPQAFEEYLRNRVMVTELLQRHYTETTTNYLNTHPLHRKLKLSKCIRRQKASEDMVAKLKSKFGNDAIFVVGNYSAPNTRYQEPARGVGFRRLLKNMDSWCI
ncbi:hypothetical protein G6F57_000936 [Rhizopus arrhizus]|uniref:Uncharacterized protein n=1 Tax=Rhizopus oryzae TaxID=64495 RepID=A0A9P7BWC3_RHIOR|nr:hypothetical protein G6F23_000080 [Rhizopus arrhizus]KAG1426863.1 hypothetical protein G6F58_001293 [Rhizopus delemar]KAG0765978.1 hypothetical protein G6F24_003975 [Rhizopus arrhizus]KAG0795696.1 hypothetical protein G6F21_001910 [Rhizopus arrhizus]KAG0801373.1 hypothetical protein G6F22_001315 [Rhizopus arrhizus]